MYTNNGITVIGPFMNLNFRSTSPISLHAGLVGAMIAVFDHMSLSTASWLMKSQHHTVEMILKQQHPDDPASYVDQMVLGQIPQDIRTMIKWLNIDPKLMIYNCCNTCFALYRMDNTPPRCIQSSDDIPSFISTEDAEPNESRPPEYMQAPSRRVPLALTMCSQPLFKDQDKTIPFRRCAFQDLRHWLARFMSRQSIEESLDSTLGESCKPFNHHSEVSDINQSRIWKEFCGADGSQFTAKSGNLTFGMYIDAINPYGNKHAGHIYSMTFVIMICLTLPYNIRYRPENIYLVAVAPGPHEPSLEQTNLILSPLILQLKSLWTTGLFLSQTPKFPAGRLVRAALLPLIADLPAMRRTLGVAGATARAFCSRCHLHSADVNNIEQHLWIPRDSDNHKRWALASRDASSKAIRQKIFEDHAVRYSVLVELDYWRPTEYHIIDSMHNILLGLLHWHC